ncbi:phospholipid transporting ATPase [Allomyces arbusculus]|nr:phospholipid transporting ATPase [Allomyces arbusculus]
MSKQPVPSYTGAGAAAKTAVPAAPLLVPPTTGPAAGPASSAASSSLASSRGRGKLAAGKAHDGKASGFSFRRFLRRKAAAPKAARVRRQRPSSALLNQADEKAPLTPTSTVLIPPSPLALLANVDPATVRRVFINVVYPDVDPAFRVSSADHESTLAPPAGGARAGAVDAAKGAPPAPAEEAVSGSGSHPDGKLPKFPTNEITTTKYNLLDFIPKNLAEQFRRVANSYFLAMVVLQFIPSLEVADPAFAAMPIVCIVAATAMKDGLEDFRRRIQDKQLNEELTLTLRDWANVNRTWHAWQTKIANAVTSCFRRRHKFQTTPEPTWDTTKWKDLRVGDFVLLNNNDPIPADVLILATSEMDGMCYIETKSLDGETNLKIRRGPAETAWLRTPRDCAELEGVVQCELPNPALYKFQATLVVRRHAAANRMNDDPEPTVVAEPVASGKGAIPSDPAPSYAALIGDDPNAVPVPIPAAAGLAGSTPSSAAAVMTPIDLLDDVTVDLSASPGPATASAAQFVPVTDENDVAGDDEDEFLQIPVTASSLLLRGCNLRNTEWVIGLVLYTGPDTKIQLNAGATPSKRTRIEKQMNPQVILNFVILFGLCCVCAVTYMLYYAAFNFERAPFALQPYETNQSELVVAVTTFFTAVIIFQNLVPISLYVSVEVVKTMQAYFIHCDEKMYDPGIDKSCSVRSWNLSDDLGQIEYVFSDKTGTLTQNVMELRKVSIAGTIYGNEYMAADAATRTRMATQFEHEIANLNASRQVMTTGKPVTFVDRGVIPAIADPHSPVHLFFLLASLCHTVLPEKVTNGDTGETTITYKAQSPDDEALVTTAQALGITFLNRSQAGIVLSVHGVTKLYDVLEIIEFNSTRKRMSVIVRDPDRGLLLLTKGADSIIFDRLATGQDALRGTTLQQLQFFANDGLRTLCLAWRPLDEAAFAAWHAEYSAAALLPTGRDEAMDAVAEKLERDLTLIGATAIEDKLQDQVPETIHNLLQAGIKVWVLTGDKVETAIAIGFSSNLLEPSMTLIVIQGDDYWSTRRQLQDSLLTLLGAAPALSAPSIPGVARDRSASTSTGSSSDPANARYALVIDGTSLRYALQDENRLLFLEVGCRCVSVVVARASPLQKAQVVDLVRKELDCLSLAIGDGANDVSMIQAANVGVGIAGHEGMQAVLASDYAIGQFRFLQRLLLVHGRWSYRRIAVMNLTFFYKNIVWTLALFWFQFYCGFSAAILFEYSYINYYNLFFTVIPTLLIGIFDQDLPEFRAEAFPELFNAGIRGAYYNTLKFATHIGWAMFHSLVAYFFGFYVYTDAIVSSQGVSSDLYEAGTAIAAYAIFIANTYMAWHIKSWTWIMVVGLGFNAVLFPLYVWGYSLYSSDSPILGLDAQLLGNTTFWVSLPLAIAISMLPLVAVEYLATTASPSDVDVIRQMSDAAVVRHSHVHAASPSGSPNATHAGTAPHGVPHPVPPVPIDVEMHPTTHAAAVSPPPPAPASAAAARWDTLLDSITKVVDKGPVARLRAKPARPRPSSLLMMSDPDMTRRAQPVTGFAFSGDEEMLLAAESSARAASPAGSVSRVASMSPTRTHHRGQRSGEWRPPAPRPPAEWGAGGEEDVELAELRGRPA